MKMFRCSTVLALCFACCISSFVAAEVELEAGDKIVHYVSEYKSRVYTVNTVEPGPSSTIIKGDFEFTYYVKGGVHVGADDEGTFSGFYKNKATSSLGQSIQLFGTGFDHGDVSTPYATGYLHEPDALNAANDVVATITTVDPTGSADEPSTDYDVERDERGTSD